MVVLSYFVAFSLVMYSTFVGIIAWRSIRMSSQEASWTFAERTSAAWACNFHVASPPILLHFKRTQCSGIPKSRRFGEFGIKITAFNWGGGEGRGGEGKRLLFQVIGRFGKMGVTMTRLKIDIFFTVVLLCSWLRSRLFFFRCSVSVY